MNAKEFNQSLVAIQDSLYRFAFSLVHNQDDAKDLLQETLIKALINREKFEEGTNLSAWTFTIMKNTFINNYQKQKRNPLSLDQTEENYSHISNKTDAPDSEIFEQELQDGISKIGDEQRIPFEMYNKGYKYKEIAESLDISVGAVKNRIFVCRRLLMDNLKEFQN